MGILDGRVAIVTGSAMGLGAGVAERYANEGARVMAVDLNEKVSITEEKIRANGGQAISAVVDLSDKEAVDAMVERTAAVFGTVDIVCNCAFAAKEYPVEDTTEDDMWFGYRNSFLTAYNTSIAAYPYLKDNKNGNGKVINWGSGATTEGSRNNCVYAPPKGMVLGLTKSLGWLWADDEINVNAICPVGWSAKMQWWLDFNAGEAVDWTMSLIPMKHFGDPVREIGGAASFLASDLSDYMTGRTFFVDGGRVGIS